jgi:ATP-dependent metalloprotease FtsH
MLYKAEPWRVEFFKDSGKFLHLNEWEGYKAVVTTSDGKQRWIDLNFPGACSYMLDFHGSGTPGAIYRKKRGRGRQLSIDEFGYNQIFEEIFASFEQSLTENERHSFLDNHFWIDARQVKYEAPGCKKLEITWHWTAPEYDIGPYTKMAPKIMFWAFTFSFIAISISISLFAKDKREITDIQDAIDFSYSKADARKDGKINVKFSDVAGIDTILNQLIEVVELLKSPLTSRNNHIKIQSPKGILLEGEPGTGKTMLAKAIAGEAGSVFYQMSGAEFIQAVVGVGAARIRDIFRRARINEPCVIFIDEIDAIGVRRSDAGIKSNEEREQTLNQLLTEMDGFFPTDGVLLIAATNRADLLDPALLRAGRFDRKITINKPNTKGREAIIRVHSRKLLFSPNVDITQIARYTSGFSAADLVNLCNVAKLEAIRRTTPSNNKFNDPKYILDKDLYKAYDHIKYGIREDPIAVTSWVYDIASATEAGKSLVAMILRVNSGYNENIVKIGIVTRDKRKCSINFARFDDDDNLIQIFGKLRDRVRILCAGRATEEILFGCSTNYAVPNLIVGQQIARKVSYQFGLCNFGAPTFADFNESKSFRNTCINITVDNIDDGSYTHSIHTGEMETTQELKHKLESVTYSLLNGCYLDAKTILTGYNTALQHIALDIKKKEVTGTQITKIIKMYPPSEDWKPSDAFWSSSV